MTTYALLLAAGAGTRLGAGCPKALVHLGGKPLYRYSLEAMAASGLIDRCLLLWPAQAMDLQPDLTGLQLPVQILAGGSTRVESVRRGLHILPQEAVPGEHRVLVHDAARPFASIALWRHLAGDRRAALVPLLPVVDTLKRVDADGVLQETVTREGVFRVQTPQAFDLALLLRAHRWAQQQDLEPTDDSQLVEALGERVIGVLGEEDNEKITSPGDLQRAQKRLGEEHVRVGQGFDIHPLGPGRPLVIGGVRVPFARGLVGHSDGDVLAHALIDALLGAAGLGSRGSLFPSSDALLKGADSLGLLTSAYGKLRAARWHLVNADVTVLAQEPRLQEHLLDMIQRLAAALDVPVGLLSVKAATADRLGALGRTEGIAAMANVLIARD